MNWKRTSAATVLLAMGVGALRYGARHLFRAEESSHQSTQACGALVWRTVTVTRTSRLEPMPVLVRAESIVELDGRPLVTDVSDFHCTMLSPPLHFVAAVARDTEGERANVSIYGAAGALERVVRFEHDVTSIAWSREASALTAIGPNGELSVVLLGRDPKPVVLSRGKSLLGSRVAWSPDGKTVCFITTARPAAEARSAELWCSTLPAAPASVVRAVWSESDTAIPWVGFELGRNNPHLCGEDLKPRDPACLGMRRSTD
jgi:hypothetical protein